MKKIVSKSVVVLALVMAFGTAQARTLVVEGKVELKAAEALLGAIKLPTGLSVADIVGTVNVGLGTNEISNRAMIALQDDKLGQKEAALRLAVLAIAQVGVDKVGLKDETNDPGQPIIFANITDENQVAAAGLMALIGGEGSSNIATWGEAQKKGLEGFLTEVLASYAQNQADAVGAIKAAAIKVFGANDWVAKMRKMVDSCAPKRQTT